MNKQYKLMCTVENTRSMPESPVHWARQLMIRL